MPKRAMVARFSAPQRGKPNSIECDELVDILPVFFLQHISHHEENAQEE